MNERLTASSTAQDRLGPLVVFDSDPELTEAIETYFRQHGFDVKSPLDRFELIDGIEKSELALAILGVNNASLEIESLVSEIRETQQGQDLPIVILAFGDTAANDRFRGDVDFVLNKPFQLGQLLRIVSAFGVGGSFSRPDTQLNTKPDVVGEPLSVPRSGDLSQAPFSEIFSQIWRAAFTGSVTLKSGSTWRRVDFNHGFPVSARSNLVTEHLHRYLLRHGFISPDTYRHLLPKTQGGKLQNGGDLEREGLLSGKHLNQARKQLIDEILMQCFRWDQADFHVRDLDDGWVSERFRINPFEVFNNWLTNPSESLLRERVSGLVGKQMEITPALAEHKHLLSELLTKIDLGLSELGDSLSAGQVSSFVDQGPASMAVLVTLSEMGVLRPVVAKPAARPTPQRPPVAEGGRKLKRLRQMVREDQARVNRAKTPYVVLGLTDGASNVEVLETYRRLSRFYRPENFARLGDVELQAVADDLMIAFNEAATDALGEVPTGPPIAKAPAPVQAEVKSEDDTILAQVFFDDGNTYFRVGALIEAQAHFARARALDQENTKYLSYHAWCTYQLGRDDPAQAMEAKQALLAALKLDSKNDRALYFLGCLYDDTGRTERAVECWEKALRANSGNFDARAALRRVGG